VPCPTGDAIPAIHSRSTALTRLSDPPLRCIECLNRTTAARLHQSIAGSPCVVTHRNLVLAAFSRHSEAHAEAWSGRQSIDSRRIQVVWSRRPFLPSHWPGVDSWVRSLVITHYDQHESVVGERFQQQQKPSKLILQRHNGNHRSVLRVSRIS
jgi:hypothetical protein